MADPPTALVAVVTVVADSFGGGTVSVQMASKNDSLGPRWVTLTNGVFTVDSIVKLDYIPVGTLIRVTLSGSSGASNVFADINQ